MVRTHAGRPPQRAGQRRRHHQRRRRRLPPAADGAQGLDVVRRPGRLAARSWSPTSRPSSASARRCRSTPAASACSPATTSRRRRTSASRSSASACCTPRATSASASTPTAGSSRASPTSPRSRSASHDTGVEVAVDLAGDAVKAHVWRADVGRIQLYMLDTDVEGNSPDGVAVTDRLYGGDEHHRLRQEIVLGIGGVRALRALGLEPDRVPHERGPRRLPRPGARPRARRRRAVVPGRRRRPCAPAACSRPTRRSRPASTASRAS